MRRIWIMAAAVLAVLAVPAAVLAVSSAFAGRSSASVNRQVSAFTATQVSTSSTSFKPVPGLTGLPACALHQVSATLSVELSGAPAGFRVRIDSGAVMEPGAIRFVPSGAHDSFSFTFVRSVSPFEANDHHVFDVEWRSPSGSVVTLGRGTFSLLFERGTHSC